MKDPFTDPKARGCEEAEEILGGISSVITYSKSAYTDSYPTHIVLFKARIFNREGDEVWSGDLDLSLQLHKLLGLAKQIGPIAVTPESSYYRTGLPEDFTGFSKRAHADVYAEANWIFVFDAAYPSKSLGRVQRHSKLLAEHLEKRDQA